MEYADGLPAVLTLRDVSKSFPGTKALSGVNLEIRSGEIHALVGQNGSGKSTLIKTLAGYHHADPGAEAWLEGDPFDMTALGSSRHDQLRFVHQDLGLVLELGVMDNLALRHSFVRRRAGNINWRAQERLAGELLRRFDVELDLRAPLSEATPVERVVVAIVSALQGWEGGGGLLVLDEPTAVLPPHEVGRLFQIVAEVRQSGTSILYVSHRLDELFQIADRVSVLRGGELVCTEEISGLTPRDLASLMAGEDVDPDYRATLPEAESDRPVSLELRNVRGHYLRGVDLKLRNGEVVGLAGLPGSGAQELPYVLAGALGAVASGEVRLASRSGQWIDVARASRLGLPLVPADRAGEAVIPEFSVRENLTLRVLDRITSGPVLSGSREKLLVHKWVDDLSVRAAGIDAPITSLSGGNQQKVILARCLASNPEVLLMCEPTAGVDIHTRIAIYDLIAAQARRGLCALVSSTDPEDLIAMCSRVVVFRDGLPADELVGAHLSKATFLNTMEGLS